MNAAFPPIAALLPHAPPMLLLDEVLDHGTDTITTAVTIRCDHPFFDTVAASVPCHVGIELMAQTCGAYAGLRAQSEGRPPSLGFLLGTRKYSCTVRRFGIGDRMEVRATVVYLDGEMGVFDCRICIKAVEIASAQLTVYQPADVTAVPTGPVGKLQSQAENQPRTGEHDAFI